jgi:hypothetical protein
VSAAEALAAARAAYIEVGLDGDDLLLEANERPSAAILELIKRHKPDIVALLRSGQDGWSAEDWRVFYEERAAIAEFDGGLTRDAAEARAFAWCLTEWLNRNFVSSPPGKCLHCGDGEHAQDPLLPYGVEQTGRAWLHSRCWSPWQAAREAKAIAALAAMGITEARFAA